MTQSKVKAGQLRQLSKTIYNPADIVLVLENESSHFHYNSHILDDRGIWICGHYAIDTLLSEPDPK